MERIWASINAVRWARLCEWVDVWPSISIDRGDTQPCIAPHDDWSICLVCLLASNRNRAACLLCWVHETPVPIRSLQPTIMHRLRIRIIAYTLPPPPPKPNQNQQAGSSQGKMAVINSEGESALPDVTRKGVEERIKALMAEAEGGGISKDK